MARSKIETGKSEEKPEIPNELIFWVEKTKIVEDPETREKEKVFDKLALDQQLFLKFLTRLGFYCLNVANSEGFVFIHIKEKMVRQISLKELKDDVQKMVRSWKKYEMGRANPELVEKILVNNRGLFKPDFLQWLLIDFELNFIKDTKEYMYFTFKNALARVSATGVEMLPHSNHELYYWESQMIDFEPSLLFGKLREGEWVDGDTFGVWGKFIHLLASKSVTRFQSLCSLLGYSMHNYFDTSLKALIFTDSAESDENEGRTGKSLITKSLKYMRAVKILDGKEFDTKDKFKWQEVAVSDQIVVINDWESNKPLEPIYTAITDGVKIQYKNMSPFTQFYKTIISTNKTIKLGGSSDRGRVIMYQVAQHFSDTHTPQMEFGHWFFSDWDATQWNQFYNFNLFCALVFMRDNVIIAESVNLGKRMLLDHTCYEFVDWIEAHGEEISNGEEHDQKLLFESFKVEFPEAKNWDGNRPFTVKHFSKYLQTYATSQSKKLNRRPSSGKYLIKLI